MRPAILPVIFLCFALQVPAQVKPELKSLEDSLRHWAHTVLKSRDTHEKKAANAQILDVLPSLLKSQESKNYRFDSLLYISVLSSPDNRLRAFTWYMINENNGHDFFGILQVRNKRYPDRVIVLRDHSDSLTDAAKKNLDPSNWFGAVYYDLIPDGKRKSGRYVLLGWDGHNELTNRKVIESITVNNRGDVKFGGTFRHEQKPVKRVIFEYGESATMSLRYDKNEKMIIFDHLSPTSPSLKDNFEFYGPDFSYDAYLLKKGKWEYVKDIKANNPDRKKKWNRP